MDLQCVYYVVEAIVYIQNTTASLKWLREPRVFSESGAGDHANTLTQYSRYSLLYIE